MYMHKIAAGASKSANIHVIPWIRATHTHTKELYYFYTNSRSIINKMQSYHEVIKMAVCASKFANIHVIPWLGPNHNKGLSTFQIHGKEQRYKSMKQNGCLCKQICKYSCHSMDLAQS